jgi:putative phosphoribosyl transferase
MDGTVAEKRVDMAIGEVVLTGAVGLPLAAPRGLAIFAHGSGSSRHSPRNQAVARVIQQAGVGTLLFDLLTAEEEESEKATGHLRFDIPFLADRLREVARWCAKQPELAKLRMGYFGSSTGGGAALMAAADDPETCSAVVSRGGRPDLAGLALPAVLAPTLLIVGSRDEQVLRLNEDALVRMTCQKELKVIPGATHLFPEKGALEEVAKAAALWFVRYFGQ